MDQTLTPSPSRLDHPRLDRMPRRRAGLDWTRASRRCLPVIFAALLAPTAVFAGPSASSSIVLTEGATYRARLKLSFFQCFASEERISRRFAKGGFSKVKVFMSKRELPADWPAQYRGSAGSCERYAEGVWSRPTMPRTPPSSVESWWMVPPRATP